MFFVFRVDIAFYLFSQEKMREWVRSLPSGFGQRSSLKKGGIGVSEQILTLA
jgi:hypothetical protein